MLNCIKCGTEPDYIETDQVLYIMVSCYIYCPECDRATKSYPSKGEALKEWEDMNKDKIEVGTHSKKTVSRINNKLYLKAKKIVFKPFTEAGLKDLSAFIDWLEENYTFEEKK